MEVTLDAAPVVDVPEAHLRAGDVLKGRNQDIERLRAFAVMFVIVAHISWIQGKVKDALSLSLVPWTGVDLFFVISGFVVAGTFERDLTRFENLDLGRPRALLAFITKRAARILPTAYGCLMFWLLAWTFFNRSGAFGPAYSHAAVLALIVSNVFFFSNYGLVAGVVPGQLGWFWSLCVEEHFYLIYPTFRMMVPRFAQRARVLALVVIVVVVGFRMLSVDRRALQQLSHNRFDQIALGVLLQMAWIRAPRALAYLKNGLLRSALTRTAWACVIAIVLAVIAMLPTIMTDVREVAGANPELFMMRVGLVVTGGLSAGLVLLASFDLDLLAFGVRPVGTILSWIGARSYALYMYHLPAQWVVQELTFRHPILLSGNRPNGAAIGMYIAALLLIVELNFRLIERPFIAMGRRRVERLLRAQ